MAATLASPADPDALVFESAQGSAAATLLDAGWDALMLRAAAPNPTLGARWLRAALAWGADGGDLVARLRMGDRVLAGIALRPARSGRGGPAQMGLLGAGRPAISPDLLVAADSPAAGADLLRRLGARGLTVAATVAAEGALAAATGRAAPWARRRPAPGGWALDLPASGAGGLRAAVAQERRRAARAGRAVDVEVATTPRRVAVAIEELIAVHAARWRGRADDAAHFSDAPAARDWYRRAVVSAAAAGAVRLAVVRIDGRAAAGALVLLAGRGGTYHTGAHRTDAGLPGAGHLAVLAACDAAAAAGVAVLDLGRGGGDQQKARLGARRRAAVSLVIGPSAQRQRILLARRELRSRARRVVGR